ncbi:aldo/keto reductase [Candidatus Rariloculus sp.]|uniref:aldo/keto reductase n=1 Tax=Candidatus Rariloculus sp. TaxID=3101265 RepID=UPI003D148DC3
MEYRNLGRTGVKVSQLCLGTMMFGRKTSAQESIRIMEHALDQGINFLDTADAYAAGETERIVGKALADNGRRARTILATKAFFPLELSDPNARGLSRRHLIRACEASLDRLGTDWIDLYQLHRAQADIPIDETLRALDDLIRAGKVRYVGTSMFPAWKIVESLWASKELGLNRFVCEQCAYHLLDRTAEREVLPAARSFGLAVIPWGPLSGGLLSGKYTRDDRSTEGRWQGGKDNFGRPVTPAAYDVMEALAAHAQDKGCTPSQLALAWNASQPGVTAPIIGPRTMEQLVDNLGAAAVAVDGEDRERIDAAAPPMSTTLRYYDAAMALDLNPNFGRW